MAILMDQIKKSFGHPGTNGQNLVLKGISGEIKDGEMVSITGRSGSGKSTLLYIISSLDKPTSGNVLIDGVSLNKIDSKELHRFRNQKMGFVFQFHHLLPELTALENVLMPSLKAEKADQLPSQLSGGEQQRVAIARALVMKPAFIFADEPTGNLDSANGLLVLNLFKRINKEHGTTILYVTHDQVFAGMATRQINLVDGLVV